MAVRCYSVRFARSYNYGGWKYYEVPTARRAVVTSLAMTNLGAAVGAFGVDIGGFWAYYSDLPVMSTTRIVDCRFTVYAGDEIGFYSAVPLIAYQANGYLFDDVVTARIPPREAVEGPPPTAKPTDLELER